MPILANKSAGCSVKFEFWINNKFSKYQYVPCNIEKLFTVDLGFQFNQVPCILSGNPKSRVMGSCPGHLCQANLCGPIYDLLRQRLAVLLHFSPPNPALTHTLGWYLPFLLPAISQNLCPLLRRAGWKGHSLPKGSKSPPHTVL